MCLASMSWLWSGPIPWVGAQWVKPSAVLGKLGLHPVPLMFGTDTSSLHWLYSVNHSPAALACLSHPESKWDGALVWTTDGQLHPGLPEGQRIAEKLELSMQLFNLLSYVPIPIIHTIKQSWQDWERKPGFPVFEGSGLVIKNLLLLCF